MRKIKKVKSFLIIGAGKLGTQVCKYLFERGHEIMLVDMQEEKLKPFLDIVTRAQVGNMTDDDVVKSIEVESFDACIVCVCNNFQHSLEITDLLKENGAKYVVAQAVTDIQSKFLLRNGADKVVYPDRDVAERLAVSISNDSIFDYIEISDDCSIFEIVPPMEWQGKTIAELQVRPRYKVSVIAVKKDGKVNTMLSAQYIFSSDEHIIVLGTQENVNALID